MWLLLLLLLLLLTKVPKGTKPSKPSKSTLRRLLLLLLIGLVLLVQNASSGIKRSKASKRTKRTTKVSKRCKPCFWLLLVLLTLLSLLLLLLLLLRKASWELKRPKFRRVITDDRQVMYRRIKLWWRWRLAVNHVRRGQRRDAINTAANITTISALRELLVKCVDIVLGLIITEDPMYLIVFDPECLAITRNKRKRVLYDKVPSGVARRLNIRRVRYHDGALAKDGPPAVAVRNRDLVPRGQVKAHGVSTAGAPQAEHKLIVLAAGCVVL